MSFTVHFIDSDWPLQSYCLDTLPLYEDHTGETIAAALQDVLDNWSLNARIKLHCCVQQSWMELYKLLWTQS